MSLFYVKLIIIIINKNFLFLSLLKYIKNFYCIERL